MLKKYEDVIENCNNCPAFYGKLGKSYCMRKGINFKSSGGEIPKWCPLETVSVEDYDKFEKKLVQMIEEKNIID